MTSDRRFSKAKVVAHLERLISALQSQYKFDQSNGWAQVKGKGEELNRAYGEFDALRTLLRSVKEGWLL